VLAAWVCHLRGIGAPVNDARAEAVVPLAAGQLTDAVRRVLGTLDPTIAADKEVVGAVLAHCEQLEHQGRP
jgi:fructuronate reductase